MSRMTTLDYPEGYWERGEGSNYTSYGDDPGWQTTALVMHSFHGDGFLYEVGAAKGWFVHWANRAGFIAQGIDISEWAVSHSAPLPVPLWLGNAVELPWDTESADVICSWEFLEHVYEDELDQVLSEMDRVLRPGGTMWHRIGIDMPGDPSHQQEDHTHYNEQSREWWEAQFDGMGYVREPAMELTIRTAHQDRDWKDRFFVWAKPS